MTQGMVSVIIPVYNAEKYIEQTIVSVISQTYKSVEIIVIDDNSGDDSARIIQALMEKYPQIRYEKLKENSGAAVARNRGIALAQGQYLAFLDSDDLWKPEKIQKQVEFLERYNAEFVYTAIEMIDEEGRLVKSKRSIRQEVDYSFLLKNTMIATSSVLLDIKRIGKFQMPDLRSGQDYATWLMLLRDGRIAYGLDEALVQYRRREGSLSSRKMRNWKKVWNIQRNYEGISPFNTGINCIQYIVNAVKKHLM